MAGREDVGSLLVDCDCSVTVYGDGSGIEMHYCDLHGAADDLLAALRQAYLWMGRAAVNASREHTDGRLPLNAALGLVNKAIDRATTGENP